MRYLYSALFYCLLPAMLLRMLWRSRRAPAYRQRLGERFGLFKARAELELPAIWVHAVSVGETLAAAPLIEALLQSHPDHRLLVTTTTPTGSEQVKGLFGGRVFHVYAPWDTPGAVHRFLHRTRPRLLLIMETEVWPNMLHYASAAGCAIVLANARLSARSARGYGRLGGFTRQMLQHVDVAACQTRVDGERLLTLGLPAAALQVTGNIKFDLELDADLRSKAMQLRQHSARQRRPVLLGASTHAGEEAQILAAFARVRERFDNCLLVLVPRHPERFDEVHALCTRAGWQVQRRSAGAGPAVAEEVLLGDTMGELLLLYGSATVAVVGGSLVEHGGHNVLEAAAWGVPVVTGPYMTNFATVSDLLTAAGAMIMLEDPDRLGACLLDLLEDSGRCQQMGAAGQQVVADNRGARRRLLALVEERLQ